MIIAALLICGSTRSANQRPASQLQSYPSRTANHVAVSRAGNGIGLGSIATQIACWRESDRGTDIAGYIKRAPLSSTFCIRSAIRRLTPYDSIEVQNGSQGVPGWQSGAGLPAGRKVMRAPGRRGTRRGQAASLHQVS